MCVSVTSAETRVFPGTLMGMTALLSTIILIPEQWCSSGPIILETPNSGQIILETLGPSAVFSGFNISSDYFVNTTKLMFV